MTRVLAFGNATVDIIQRIARFPAKGETLLAEGLLRCPGGKGLNQAVAAARAGASTTLVAPIGRDGDGAFLTRFVDGEADLEATWLTCDAPTDVSIVWVDRGGENMIVSSAGCACSTTVDQARVHCAALNQGDILLMQGNLSADVTRVAAETARQKGAMTMLNTAPITWDMGPILPLFHVVVANEVEAAFLTGGTGESAPPRLIERGARTVVVTLGARGALLAGPEGCVRIAAPEVQARDTAGAGDVLVGTLAGVLAQGARLSAATEIAVHAAALSVTRAGTTASFPSREELSELNMRIRN